MKKELIFLGPPACGKGTQTTMLAQFLKFPHIDTGSLLRAKMIARTGIFWMGIQEVWNKQMHLPK